MMPWARDCPARGGASGLDRVFVGEGPSGVPPNSDLEDAARPKAAMLPLSTI
jgi:hypothetical protein